MLSILLTLLVLDSLYLGIHYTFFQKVFQNIQHKPLQFRVLPAIFVYVCLTFFVYKLLYYRVSDIDAFLLGASVYGVYEGTNYATFQSWPPYMFFLDTLWGGILIYLTMRVQRFLSMSFVLR